MVYAKKLKIVAIPMKFFINVCKLFSVLFLGGMGGFLFPPIFGLIQGNSIPSGGDAISIANTYIVFTTIIFAGLAVVLAIIGFVFSQQFAVSKELQLQHLTNDLQGMIKENKLDIGIKLVDIALKNNDVRKHLESKLDVKVYQLLKEKYEFDGDIDINSIKESIGGLS